METPDGKVIQRFINPYKEPFPCKWECRYHASHGGNHAGEAATNNCSLHGCCTLQTIDLPCKCADGADWGNGIEGEDITLCEHFRVFHEYKFRKAPEAAVAGSHVKAWPKYQYPDEWIIPRPRRGVYLASALGRDGEGNGGEKDGGDEGGDDPNPEFYCTTPEWDAVVNDLIESGETLDFERGSVMKLRYSGPDDFESGSALGRTPIRVTTRFGFLSDRSYVPTYVLIGDNEKLRTLWEQQYYLKMALYRLDASRADALFGGPAEKSVWDWAEGSPARGVDRSGSGTGVFF